MRRRAIALLGAFAAGVSCGPVAAPPPPPVPLNVCPDHACSAFKSADPVSCTETACVTNSSFDFTLVVSLPETSFFAPSMTITIPSFASAPLLNPTPCNLTALGSGVTCLRLPATFEPTGELLVENQAIQSANASGSYIDTIGDFTQWSLPVHVQYWPLWPFVSASAPAPLPTLVGAASVGLPLAPVESASLATSSPGVGSPRGIPPTQWKTPLALGTYERDIVPDNDAFPVVIDSPVPAGAPEYSLPMSSVIVDTIPITRPGLSLDGFAVYMRDATTLHRFSSRATLGDGPSALVTLLRAALPSKVQLVIAPPAGSPIPYLADSLVTLSALGQNQVLAPETFPALPPPVAVSGLVEGPDSSPVEASLVIDSVAASASTGGILTSDLTDPAEPFLHYSTTAQTDGNGRYAVTLPPGTYDVFVIPAEGSNAAAASVRLAVGSPLPSDGGTEPPVASGKTLQLPARSALTGVATIADGRPLAGATVQAHAAASLAATVDPRRWPRAQTTVTDATGAFTMSVDPGTYDVVVQPANGTGFPWTTLSSQIVPAGGKLALTPIVVPAPHAIHLVLHDPGDNALVQTVVRAFAPAAGATSAIPGGPLPVIEIGSWLTDTSGHLTMLLAPPH